MAVRHATKQKVGKAENGRAASSRPKVNVGLLKRLSETPGVRDARSGCVRWSSRSCGRWWTSYGWMRWAT